MTTQQICSTYPITIVSGSHSHESQMIAHYRADDPCAVTFAIHDPCDGGRVVDWRFARVLLGAAGIPGLIGNWVGGGDVSVKFQGGSALVRLRGHDGEATLIMRREVIVEFFNASCRMISPGSEEESAAYTAAIDLELRDLLDGAA